MKAGSLLFLVLLFCVAAGQMAAAQDEAIPRPVTVRIVQLTGKPEGLYLRGKEDVRCQLSQRRISAPVDTVVFDDVIRFYRKQDSAQTEGGAMYELAGEAVLPPQGKNFLLLFVQSPDAQGGYRVVALPRDDQAGKSGQVVFYNLSSYPVVGQSAQEQFRIEQGKATVIRPGAGKNNNLSLRLARYANDNWEVAFNTVWGSNPALNTLFFIFNADAGKDAIDVRRFYDTPIAAATASGS